MIFNKSIYLDIAALLDLRQGAMAVLSSTFAVKVTTNEQYYLRDTDIFSAPDFGELTTSTLNSIMSRRSPEVFRASMRTKIVQFIQELFLRLIKENAKDGIELNLGIDINFFPYDAFLTPDEVSAITQSVRDHFEGRLSVKAVSYNPAVITFRHVSDAYVAMIFYNYGTWAQAREEEFKTEKSFPKVPIFIPRLFFGEKPPAAVLKEYTDKGVDVFEMWEKVTSNFMNINYLPTAFFSVDLPANLDTYTTLEKVKK